MRRRDWVEVLHPFAVTRGLLLVWAWVSLRIWPVVLEGDQWQAFPNHPFLDAWARFDSGWYWSIANVGYYVVPDEQTNVPFFPAFSIVTKTLATPLQAWFLPEQAFYVAGIIVSYIAFYLALVAIYR